MEKGSSVHMAGIEAHENNNVSNPGVAKMDHPPDKKPVRPVPGILVHHSLRQSGLQRPCKGLTLSVSTLG